MNGWNLNTIPLARSEFLNTDGVAGSQRDLLSEDKNLTWRAHHKLRQMQELTILSVWVVTSCHFYLMLTKLLLEDRQSLFKRVESNHTGFLRHLLIEPFITLFHGGILHSCQGVFQVVVPDSQSLCFWLPQASMSSQIITLLWLLSVTRGTKSAIMRWLILPLLPH